MLTAGEFNELTRLRRAAEAIVNNIERERRHN